MFIAQSIGYREHIEKNIYLFKTIVNEKSR